MLYQKIYLKDFYELDSDANIEIMVPINRDFEARDKTRAIIVVPGGGYSFVSKREADPVAIEFLRQNFVTITLEYSTHRAYPYPQFELACAFDYVRRHADELFVDKDKISAIGFSAGGHLVGSYGYLYQMKEFLNLGFDEDMIKPNCLILSYPVILMNEKAHQETKEIITGNSPYLLDLLSIDKHIDSNYPPTFIWTTVEDDIVPYENSVVMAEKLKEKNIEHEFFLYPYLHHGLSVVNPLNYSSQELENKYYQEVSLWFSKCVEFIKKVLS